LVSDYQSRKENDLQIIVPRKEFIQSQESGGMVMASMWNKGTELGMKKFTEPIKGFNSCSSCSPTLLPN